MVVKCNAYVFYTNMEEILKIINSFGIMIWGSEFFWLIVCQIIHQFGKSEINEKENLICICNKQLII